MNKTKMNLEDIAKMMIECDRSQLPKFVALNLKKLPPITADCIDILAPLLLVRYLLVVPLLAPHPLVVPLLASYRLVVPLLVLNFLVVPLLVLNRMVVPFLVLRLLVLVCLGQRRRRTGEEAVSSYVREQTGAEAVTAVKLPTRFDSYESYRLDIVNSPADLDILDPQLWAEGLIVRRFFQRR
ncbi:hypothetical protein FJT64_020525 [Amphibalanus amphitrite]|uniref:Uncharacterized protein n=1 Tax=Amphibalanus amphitrite TaxID=1232801 RepID=A0A6A4WKZ3_AMPAM|nr:hypothetical protein FJT64_022519 [Amphibalanus amphitrite]KAF0308241.1 hypothetical protein FJT64_020525 [Amphibalanus amphitrite]